MNENVVDFVQPLCYIIIIKERKVKEMRKERTYTVKYRERGKKDGQVFETSITARNNIEAREIAREDLGKEYVIASVKAEL